ncbi:MAG: VIT domain-containing protein [Kofleriaceae bacterium]
MNKAVLAAVVAVGCQSSDSTGQLPDVASAITPMQIVRAEPAREAVAPFTLTASDGTGLLLVRVDAKAVVEGPLAFTELHLYFHNDEDRTREGTFAITLPAGAAISRFAMENADQWQEAEVVDKALARRAYDDFLHRRQDPALLEKAAGNQFTARVFPLPPKSDKHLVFAFSQELVGRTYALPLRGLPKTERVDVQLTSTTADGRRTVQALNERNWSPDRDFVAASSAPAAAVTAGEFVVGSLAFAPANTLPQEPPKDLTLLVDTSASRALGFAGYVASIRTLVSALRAQYGDPIALRVIAFDQDSQQIFDGAAADYGDAQDRALLDRGAAGASNLAVAIAATGAHRRAVIVTDGVATAGPDTPALVEAIRQTKLERLDVVLAGGIRDERLAASLARALPHAGDVHDLDRGIDHVAAGLGEAVLVDVAISVPGAVWVYPKRLPAARPGSSVAVYARMAKPTRTLEVVIGGRSRTVGLAPATPVMIERAVAGAEIEELENTLATLVDDEVKKAMREEIAKRSVHARVISSQTAMLVLESDADYARYKIERSALAEILVVGPAGVETTRRTSYVWGQPTPPPPPPEPARSPIDERLLSREEAIEDARSAGVMALDEGVAGKRGGFASITGSADISTGFDDSNIYGGTLAGDPVNETAGNVGIHRGFGQGGGGTGGGGRYGTIGQGTGAGYGVGGGWGSRRTAIAPAVVLGQSTVTGSLDRAIIRRYVKRNLARIQYCYERELLGRPGLAGALAVEFAILPGGSVGVASVSGFDTTVATCVGQVVQGIVFPRPPNGTSTQVSYPLEFRPSASSPTAPRYAPSPTTQPIRLEAPAMVVPDRNVVDDSPAETSHAALTGKLAEVMRLLNAKSIAAAAVIATAWHAEAPGDILALIALGEVLEAKRDLAGAARMYGSIIDLYGSRADFRRFAGERLGRLGTQQELVIDTYRRAVADRPDHVTGHRLLAYALVRSADYAGAFAAILAGLDQKYPDNRFLGADRVLHEDAGMIAAAYIAHGGNAAEITAQLEEHGVTVATKPSTRFILYWETDANDVDFHIRDARGGHAWYSSKELPSGGELYADVTTGYGPECFAIPGTPAAGPYKLAINYFSQGPMGYGMGLLQIQRFDGKTIAIEDRPYVIMTNQAFVDLGTY